MSSEWVQMCAGGPRWRDLPNGQIEVEGLGVPLAESTGYFADATFVQGIWDQWGPLITQYSQSSGVPVPRIIAIMDIESRGKNYPLNSAGAGGLMALLQSTMNSMLGRPGSITDVNDSLDAGTRFLAQLDARYQGQLPAIAAAYNAGSAKCSPTTRCKSTVDGSWGFDGSTADNSMGFVEDCTKGHGSAYSLRAVQVNNTAIEMGLGGGGGPAGGAAGPLALVAFLGLTFALVAWRRDIARLLGVDLPEVLA